MSNPFSPDNLTPTWSKAIKILKGDLPGHEFHGNQWTTGESGGAKIEFSDIYRVGQMYYRTYRHTGKIDEPYDGYSRTAEGREKLELARELQARLTGGHLKEGDQKGPRSKFSQKEADRARANADIFLAAVEQEARPSKCPIFRGIMVKPETKFTVGQKLEMPISSWTAEKDVAVGYSNQGTDGKVVVFTADTGTVGANLGAMIRGDDATPNNSSTGHVDQILSGGNFKVTDVQETPNATIVSVKQTEFFAK